MAIGDMWPRVATLQGLTTQQLLVTQRTERTDLDLDDELVSVEHDDADAASTGVPRRCRGGHGRSLRHSGDLNVAQIHGFTPSAPHSFTPLTSCNQPTSGRLDKQAAAPPHMDGSIVFTRWRQCALPSTNNNNNTVFT